jgi:ElaB/YqjD/DUF883 family membrane-anchored ribosome-binding protein
MDKQRDQITRREVECEEPGVTRYRGAQGVQTSSMEGAREIQEIRRDIAETRADMAETMHVLRQRLSPEHLKQQAKDATVGRAKDAVDDARSQVKSVRQSAMETIRQNPIPAAMVALGLGWLIVEGKGPRVGHAPPDYSPVGSRVNQFAGGVQSRAEEVADEAESAMLKAKLAAEEKVHQVGEVVEQAQERVTQIPEEAKAKAEELRVEVQQQAEYAKTRVGEFVHQNPLAAGAIALAVGAALGSLIPETPQEDALMGEQHDRLMSEAGERVQDTLERAQDVAKEVAQSAKETGKEEAKRQDLIPDTKEQQKR